MPAILMEPESSVRARLVTARRIVVKLGTNVLTAGTDHLDLAMMASLVDQVARLLSTGREVIVVSSGAVAAGRHLLAHYPGTRSSTVPLRQMLASIGQSRLMAAYDQLFAWQDRLVAQALLTRADLADRQGYLNARTTLLSLLENGVVPIVNENDVVAVEEIRDLTFGDNDALSAQVANLVDADLLIILTDTGGLYTSDPASDPDATLVRFVETVDDGIEAMAGGSASGRGRGGMATKVGAARLATSAGVAVVIAPGREPSILATILAGEPAGTLFAAAATRIEGRKRWLLSGLGSKGTVAVDSGAVQALRVGGKSLLAVGITDVSGGFNRGDVVDVVGPDRVRVAYGVTSYAAGDLRLIRGCRSDQFAERLGFDFGSEIIHRNNLVVVERS